MTATTTYEADLAALRDDLDGLKRDVAGLLDHLKIGATNGARSATQRIDDSLKQLGADASAQGVQAAKAIGRQIEAQPFAALLIAVGLGYIGARTLLR